MTLFTSIDEKKCHYYFFKSEVGVNLLDNYNVNNGNENVKFKSL